MSGLQIQRVMTLSQELLTRYGEASPDSLPVRRSLALLHGYQQQLGVIQTRIQYVEGLYHCLREEISLGYDEQRLYLKTSIKNWLQQLKAQHRQTEAYLIHTVFKTCKRNVFRPVPVSAKVLRLLGEQKKYALLLTQLLAVERLLNCQDSPCSQRCDYPALPRKVQALRAVLEKLQRVYALLLGLYQQRTQNLRQMSQQTHWLKRHGKKYLPTSQLVNNQVDFGFTSITSLE